MSVQLELPIATKAPRVSEQDVEALRTFLAGGEWVKARDFPPPWNDRFLRAVANASGGHVISGQRGYKLTTAATIAEVQHATAWLRHQAGEMTRRAVEIDRVYHKKLQ
ncbi:MAG TPA: hypothetical protein VFV83_08780 [Chthoniobacteraceae bacterium]|nr:hypothetical protein [Chthoniobacteraceae bacterium]